MNASEAARELEKVARALDEAHVLIAGLDQVRAAIDLTGEPRYSPLRTLIEHSSDGLGRVMAYLRTTSQL